MSIFGKLLGKEKSAAVLPQASLQALAERFVQAATLRIPGIQTRIVLGDSGVGCRVELLFPDGGTFNQFLGNLWVRYQTAPHEMEASFEEQFANIKQIRANRETGEPAVQGTILPVIKTRAWHEVSVAQFRQTGMAESEAPFVVRPLAGDLVVTYVQDTPASMAFLSQHKADQLGLAGEALHAHALQNLAAMLPQLDVQGGDGRYAARLDRNYDASMILLFERWRDCIDVPGDPVLAVAARDELLVAGTADIDTLLALQQMATQIVEQSAYALTDRLFVYRRSRLAPLMIASKGNEVVLVELDGGARLNAND